MTTDDADQIATPRVAAGALSVDAAGRVLLVKPTYKRGWDIPGAATALGVPALRDQAGAYGARMTGGGFGGGVIALVGDGATRLDPAPAGGR